MDLDDCCFIRDEIFIVLLSKPVVLLSSISSIFNRTENVENQYVRINMLVPELLPELNHVLPHQS